MNTLKNCQSGQEILFHDIYPLPDLSQISDKEYIFSGIFGESSQVCKGWRGIRHIQNMEMTYKGKHYKLTGCMPDIGQLDPSKFVMSIWDIGPM